MGGREGRTKPPILPDIGAEGCREWVRGIVG
jgi:hypothetical protein